MRPFTSWFAPSVPLLLLACAPLNASGPVGPAFRAAFSDAGVAWVSGGRACVARGPSFVPSCPRLPPVTDVAWNGGDAWGAVPALGQVITLDRSARAVPVGRVQTLSSARVYREDGSAVTYAGEPARGVLGGPTAAVTGGDGGEFVVLGGALVRLSDGLVLEARAGAFLMATPQGARTGDAPAAVTAFGTYRLAGGLLERLDGAGRVVASVPHGPGRVGVVGADVVTVDETGRVQVFTLELLPC